MQWSPLSQTDNVFPILKLSFEVNLGISHTAQCNRFLHRKYLEVVCTCHPWYPDTRILVHAWKLGHFPIRSSHRGGGGGATPLDAQVGKHWKQGCSTALRKSELYTGILTGMAAEYWPQGMKVQSGQHLSWESLTLFSMKTSTGPL